MATEKLKKNLPILLNSFVGGVLKKTAEPKEKEEQALPD